MRRYLLDTCAMGDLINRRKGVHERARAARLGGARLGTCIPVLGELFFGIELSQNVRRQADARCRISLCRLSDNLAFGNLRQLLANFLLQVVVGDDPKVFRRNDRRNAVDSLLDERALSKET